MQEKEDTCMVWKKARRNLYGFVARDISIYSTVIFNTCRFIFKINKLPRSYSERAWKKDNPITISTPTNQILVSIYHFMLKKETQDATWRNS